MLLYKRRFGRSKVGISQKVKSVIMHNLCDTIFIWRRTLRKKCPYSELLQDFHVCINVPLSVNKLLSPKFIKQLHMGVCFNIYLQSDLFVERFPYSQICFVITFKKHVLQFWLNKTVNNRRYRLQNINSFQPNVSFLYPLKTSENLWFSEVLRGYENVTLG